MGDSVAERMDAGWQAARHWETECETARAERDALAAQLAALKKRVADAERVVALGYVEHSAGKFFLPSHGVDKYGTYALVRLEDGE